MSSRNSGCCEIGSAPIPTHGTDLLSFLSTHLWGLGVCARSRSTTTGSEAVVEDRACFRPRTSARGVALRFGVILVESELLHFGSLLVSFLILRHQQRSVAGQVSRVQYYRQGCEKSKEDARYKKEIQAASRVGVHLRNPVVGNGDPVLVRLLSLLPTVPVRQSVMDLMDLASAVDEDGHDHFELVPFAVSQGNPFAVKFLVIVGELNFEGLICRDFVRGHMQLHRFIDGE
mmetsp:Transcript_22744/g.35616  ORF Transcript_22744/g.35616 Transcript_22744/m.35616 type:complete len:231 (-) Transcript_22744:304-996(-)